MFCGLMLCQWTGFQRVWSPLNRDYRCPLCTSWKSSAYLQCKLFYLPDTSIVFPLRCYGWAAWPSLSGSTSVPHAHNLPIILLVQLQICRIHKARQPPLFLTASPISLMLTKAYKLVRPPSRWTHYRIPDWSILSFSWLVQRRVGQLYPIKFLTLRTHTLKVWYVCVYTR